jgi:hypothetical protein
MHRPSRNTASLRRASFLLIVISMLLYAILMVHGLHRRLDGRPLTASVPNRAPIVPDVAAPEQVTHSAVSAVADVTSLAAATTAKYIFAPAPAAAPGSRQAPPARRVLFIGVFTVAGHVRRRELIRASYRAFAHPDATLVFVVGRTNELAEEQARHQDLLLLPCEENMNEGKTLHFFREAGRRYPRHLFYLKADDDTYLNVPDVVATIRRHQPWKPLYYGRAAGCVARVTPLADAVAAGRPGITTKTLGSAGRTACRRRFWRPFPTLPPTSPATKTAWPNSGCGFGPCAGHGLRTDVPRGVSSRQAQAAGLAVNEVHDKEGLYMWEHSPRKWGNWQRPFTHNRTVAVHPFKTDEDYLRAVEFFQGRALADALSAGA